MKRHLLSRMITLCAIMSIFGVQLSMPSVAYAQNEPSGLAGGECSDEQLTQIKKQREEKAKQTTQKKAATTTKETDTKTAQEPTAATETQTQAPFEPDLGYLDIKCALPQSIFSNFSSLANSALGLANFVVGSLAFIALLVTGIMFITAGGDEDKAKKAKRNIGWVVAGIAIYILMAWSLAVLRGIIDTSPQKANVLSQPEPASQTATTQQAPASQTVAQSTVSTAAKPPITTITISEGILNPETLEVPENTLVTWTNNDTIPHLFENIAETTITGPSEIDLPPKGSYTFRFTDAGEYHYSESSPDGKPDPTGKVIVTKSTSTLSASCPTTPELLSSEEFTVSFSGGVASPPAAYITTGTKISWINFDDKRHYVTEDSARSTISGPIPFSLITDQIYTYTFDTPGTFAYYDETNPTSRYAICVYLRPSTQPSPVQPPLRDDPNTAPNTNRGT